MDGEDHVTDAEVTLHDEALTDSDYEGASVVLTDDENEVPHLRLVNGTPISGNTKDPYISEDEDWNDYWVFSLGTCDRRLFWFVVFLRAKLDILALAIGYEVGLDNEPFVYLLHCMFST